MYHSSHCHEGRKNSIRKEREGVQIGKEAKWFLCRLNIHQTKCMLELTYWFKKERYFFLCTLTMNFLKEIKKIIPLVCSEATKQ